MFPYQLGDVPRQKPAAQERISAQGGEDDGQDDGKYRHGSTHVWSCSHQVDAWIAADEQFPLLCGAEGKTYKLSAACQDPEGLVQLTDEWVNQTIRNSSDPGLGKARMILKRIDDRDTYK